MTFNKRELIRESKWARVYKLESQEGYFHESKFLFDDLSVSLSTIRKDWLTFPLEEKIEFARAFSFKRELRGEDEAILDFLMESGPQEVWTTIAPRLPSHRDSARVTAFLLDRIETDGEPRANYYQAIELLHAAEAVPLLRRRYAEYRSQLSSGLPDRDALTSWTDYLSCCKALLSLTKDSTFLAVLKEGPATVPSRLQPYAALLLREVEKPNG